MKSRSFFSGLAVKTINTAASCWHVDDRILAITANMIATPLHSNGILKLSKSACISAVFILVLCSSSTLHSSSVGNGTTTLRPKKELKKFKQVEVILKKINKPYVKTIQSPDGDIIDCVLAHKQPAFDHPLLKGTSIQELPENLKGYNQTGTGTRNFQLWSSTGASCPENTVPIRRTTKDDIYRASDVLNFGKKLASVQTDSPTTRHEHAVAYAAGEKYYGAKCVMSVWAPNVLDGEFSVSQIWVTSHTSDDLNTIEAGWMVSPELYGDRNPRLFVYWTSDNYQTTGCYNLLCSGFVQINKGIAIGAVISPQSTVNGNKFEIELMIFKDPKHGHWWLSVGEGKLIGYWPSWLFSRLSSDAAMLQFGGEVVNSLPNGCHTSTQMGSGHLTSDGPGQAAYFRNLQTVDSYNNLVPITQFTVTSEKPNCYDITAKFNNQWGSHFYYGGPGKNLKCP